MSNTPNDGGKDMAKINARGAHEVARWEAFRFIPADEHGPAQNVRWLYLLRSDGKLLRRLADNASGMQGGYSIAATLKDKTMSATERIAACERYIAKRADRVSRTHR